MNACVCQFPPRVSELQRARDVLRSPDFHDYDTVSEACAVLDQLGRDPDDRLIACEVRRAMGARAASEVNADMRSAMGGIPVRPWRLRNVALALMVTLSAWSIYEGWQNFWAVTEEAAMGDQ